MNSWETIEGGKSKQGVQCMLMNAITQKRNQLQSKTLLELTSPEHITFN